jgi:uncharacterized protein YkwD
MSLIAPPPIMAPEAVVPGGPVYTISAALWAWLTGKGTAPWKPKPAPPPPAPLPVPDSDYEAVILGMNRERAARGLPGFAYDPKLGGLAQSWANTMASQNVLYHGNFAGRMRSVYPNSWAGENVAEGPTTAAGVVAMWMNSPPHRANILKPEFRMVGVGAASASGGTQYFCADFKG